MKLLFNPHSLTLWSQSSTLPTPNDDSYKLPIENLVAGDKVMTPYGVSTVQPSMDFETYSEAGFKVDPVTKKVTGVGPNSKGGLPVVGTPVYAEHPSTEVLCLVYDLKNGSGRQLWVPGMPAPHDLLCHVAGGGMLEAWNATFEWWIWNMICSRRYGWPALQIEQTICVMARSRRYSLPGGLDNAAKVLEQPPKDPDGKRLLQKLSRPHTPTKTRPKIRWDQVTAWEDFRRLYGYCDGDVISEDSAAAHIPDLSAFERETWVTDQRINARGMQVDTESLDACIALMQSMFEQYTLELVTICEGRVSSVSELEKMLTWLDHNGCHLNDLQADTIKETLKQEWPPKVKRVLEIRQTLAGANIKKLPKIKLQISSDGRIRNQYLYCGADQTGRWSAGGGDSDETKAQMQNITAKGPKAKKCDCCSRIVGADCSAGVMGGCPECGSTSFTEVKEWDVNCVECALYDIRSYGLKQVTDIWGDPSDLLAGCLRGLFIAGEGQELICCDFSAIEAVIAACIAGCQWRIDVFQTHGRIYEASISQSTGVPLEEILEYKRVNGTHHPLRKRGKVRELAGGFGGWLGAWKNFGADEFMTDDEIKKDIRQWRADSPEIVEMWGGQYKETFPGSWEFYPCLYGLEGAAILAILNPGIEQYYKDITYCVSNDVLFCKLPSGRFLQYHRPRLVDVQDRRAKQPAYQITFEGFNTNTMKGRRGWIRMDTYGGRLFENVVQGIGADLQAGALNRLEANGYPVVLHTHDEACAELSVGQGDVNTMCRIMAERPAWASWWPIKADGWVHKRYQKD